VRVGRGVVRGFEGEECGERGKGRGEGV